MLHNLNTGMNVKDSRGSIQYKGKRRYDLYMLDKPTETPIMEIATTLTEDCDLIYNLPICYDTSSHVYETETY